MEAADAPVVESAAAASPQSVPLHRRLWASPAAGKTVAQTLNEYLREGNFIKKYELDRCIKNLRNYGRFRHALEIMEWMVKRNVNLSKRDHAICLDLISKAHGIEDAENYFNALASPEKNKFTYGALFNCYCKEMMEEKALSLFQKMDKLGFANTTLAFNGLMSLYIKLRKPEKVPELIKEMRGRNVSLTSVSYNIWMQSHAFVDDIEGMERVFEEMKRESDEHCDWTTYSNLAVNYSKAGLREKAESALRMLEKEMGPRNRLAYHYLISLYAGISNLIEVHRVWTLLKSDLPKLNNTSYIVILQALDKLNDIEGVRRLYSEWESSYSTFDMRVTNTAIKSFLRADMIGEAESTLRAAFGRSNGPFFTAWELLIEFFLRKRNAAGAMKYLEAAVSRVEDNEWKPNPIYIEKLLEYFEEDRDIDRVEELRKMLKRINSLDLRVYLPLLRAYIAAGKMTVDDMSKRMEEDGIEMNSEIENLLQRACPK